MKRLSLVLLMLAFIGTAYVTSSCAHKGHKHSATEEAKQGKEYTSAYVCPMHCEGSGSEEPGKCPACGMDYVKNEEHQSEEHQH